MQTNAKQPTRQNPITFYLRVLLYMFVALLLRAITFAPLAFLFLFPAGSPWQYLALLCPVLLVFFLLPLRFSFADALVQRPHQRNFSFDIALSTRHYGSKLGQSLLHLLSVAKWGIPLAALLGYGYWSYVGTDMSSLRDQLSVLGTQVAGFGLGIANWFRSLFGSIDMLTYDGTGFWVGVGVILTVLALTILLLLWGTLRNSAYRYIWALAKHQELPPHKEARRRLKGRRWTQLFIGLVNLVLWAPFLYMLAITLKDVTSDISTTLAFAMSGRILNLPGLGATLFPVLFALLVLYMPLLPLRRILTAHFATKNIPDPPEPEPEAIPAPGPAPSSVETDSATPAPAAATPYPTPAASPAPPTQEEPPSEPAPQPAPAEAPIVEGEAPSQAAFSPVPAYTPGSGDYSTPAAPSVQEEATPESTPPTYEAPTYYAAPVQEPAVAETAPAYGAPELAPVQETASQEAPLQEAATSSFGFQPSPVGEASVAEEAPAAPEAPAPTQETNPWTWTPNEATSQPAEAVDWSWDSVSAPQAEAAVEAPASETPVAEAMPEALEVPEAPASVADAPAEASGEAPADVHEGTGFATNNPNPEPPAFTIGQ